MKQGAGNKERPVGCKNPHPREKHDNRYDNAQPERIRFAVAGTGIIDTYVYAVDERTHGVGHKGAAAADDARYALGNRTDDNCEERPGQNSCSAPGTVRSSVTFLFEHNILLMKLPSLSAGRGFIQPSLF